MGAGSGRADEDQFLWIEGLIVDATVADAQRATEMNLGRAGGGDDDFAASRRRDR